MKLAFYAPLKAPDHPVPSGDRTMARALIAALEKGGCTLTQASPLRSRDGQGDADVQDQICQQAKAECQRLIALGQQVGWHAWVTYHSYYKAPDLLGPTVAKALNIPYLQIEATRARKRLRGPWARFAAAAEAACDAADVIFYLTARDAEALQRDAPPLQKLIHLRPFLPYDTLPEPGQHSDAMLAVGMLRAGDKFDSYRLISQTLALLPKGGWQLNIAGDGPAREAVEQLMAPFGEAVRFLGELDTAALSEAYRNSALLFWPGVNEAFGLAYLEAQAHGLPVVAQDRPGVRDVLSNGSYPAPDQGPEALAAQLQTLLSDHQARQAAGQAAREYVGEHHLLSAATTTLMAGLAAAGCTP